MLSILLPFSLFPSTEMFLQAAHHLAWLKSFNFIPLDLYSLSQDKELKQLGVSDAQKLRTEVYKAM